MSRGCEGHRQVVVLKLVNIDHTVYRRENAKTPYHTPRQTGEIGVFIIQNQDFNLK